MTPAWNVPTAVGQSNTAANWQKGSTPAWNSISSSKTPNWSSSSKNESHSEDTKEEGDKQPWDQVKNWNKED
jgi:transcription elongation factor